MASDDAPPAALGSLKDRRVLVVDSANRLLIQMLLQSWQAIPLLAAGAAEALDIMRRAREEGRPVELVLLDHQMPDFSGMDLARDIKSDPNLQATPLVMITSVGLRGDAALAKKCAAGRLPQQACQESDLRQVIELVLGSRQAGAAFERDTRLVTRHTIADSARRARIRVAEDDRMNQRVTLKMLSRIGYQADVVSDGCEALEALRMRRFDLILMDCQMPRMDGYEATREILAAYPDKRPVIVALTANALKEDRQRCLDAGMDDYFSKPIDPDALRETIGRWLDGGALQSES